MKRPPGYAPLKFQRDVRKNMTEPEKRLWNALRNRQLNGMKFRKQTWLGPFLVDFFCAEARLFIEVDGDSHAQQQDYDERRRTKWLEAEGFRMTRFSNEDVMRNLEGVVTSIADAVSPSPSHPAAPGGPLPLPQRGEGS